MALKAQCPEVFKKYHEITQLVNDIHRQSTYEGSSPQRACPVIGTFTAEHGKIITKMGSYRAFSNQTKIEDPCNALRDGE